MTEELMAACDRLKIVLTRRRIKLIDELGLVGADLQEWQNKRAHMPYDSSSDECRKSVELMAINWFFTGEGNQ